MVLIKGVPMRVIGLLAAKGQTGYGQDQDDVVMIPFNTAERKVLGVAAPQAAQNLVSANYPPARQRLRPQPPHDRLRQQHLCPGGRRRTWWPPRSTR